jgi:hypothetical protein
MAHNVCRAIRGRFLDGCHGTRGTRATDTSWSSSCLGHWSIGRHSCFGWGSAATCTRARRRLCIRRRCRALDRSARSGGTGCRCAGTCASASAQCGSRACRCLCSRAGWRGCSTGCRSIRHRRDAPCAGTCPGSLGSAIHRERSRHRCRCRLSRRLPVLSRRILAPLAAASYWSFLIFWHIGLLKRYGTARNQRLLIPPYPASKNQRQSSSVAS